MKINKDFKDLEDFLVGEPKQFLIEDGSVFCVREAEEEGGDPCQDCPYNQECEFTESFTQLNLIPQSRRGIGFEEESFLILRFKDQYKSMEDVPEELWDTPFSNLAENEYNIHFILKKTYLSNPDSKLWVIKGHYRYYGGLEEFENDPLSEYFQIFDQYIPQHKLVAFDYSAIEPRVTTILSQEPLWMDVFEADPQPVAYEVNLDE